MHKMPKVNKQKPPAQPVSLTMEEANSLPGRACANCKCEMFQEALRLKTLSALHPGNRTGQIQTLPLKVVVCVLCKEELK